MKTIIISVAVALMSFTGFAQKKKVATTKKASTTKTASKSFPARGFTDSVTLSQVTDIQSDHPTYDFLYSLINDYGVMIVYSDNKFRGNENLKRGDFAVHFNSALESVRDYMDSLKQDTTMINTYDKNRSYITSVSEVRDLTSSSLYYSAVRSLLENWGIAAMFKKDKKLNANASITEAEVYDILNVTMGYKNTAVARRPVPIKRDAFAVMLAEAISQLRQRVVRLPKPVPTVTKDTIYIQQPFK
jgi:hypothetical protein